MYGYSAKRRRIGASRRNSYSNAMLARTPSSVMRTIGVPSLMHSFKRMGNVSSISCGSVGSVPFVVGATNLSIGPAGAGLVFGTREFGGSMYFSLANCVTNNELTTLFDNYRIKSVQVKIDYSANQAPGDGTVPGGTSNNVACLPFIYVTPDFDDNTIPGAITDVQQHSLCRSARLGDKSMVVNLTPRAQQTIQVTSGGGGVPPPGGAGGMLPKGTWIDTGSPAVQHYGIKFWLTDVPTALGNANSTVLRFTTTYFLECKNVN